MVSGPLGQDDASVLLNAEPPECRRRPRSIAGEGGPVVAREERDESPDLLGGLLDAHRDLLGHAKQEHLPRVEPAELGRRVAAVGRQALPRSGPYQAGADRVDADLSGASSSASERVR